MVRLSILVASLFLAVTTTSVFGQTPSDPHHPPQAGGGPPQTNVPAPGSGMGGMGMPMMGSGMHGMMSMMSGDHIEGRIAFLRTELKITDAQMSVWNAFADALRLNSQKLRSVHDSMMGQGQQQPPTLSTRMDLQERWLGARLDGIRAIKQAFTPLYAALSDDQKRTADELLEPHMGMMPMGGR